MINLPDQRVGSPVCEISLRDSSSSEGSASIHLFIPDCLYSRLFRLTCPDLFCLLKVDLSSDWQTVCLSGSVRLWLVDINTSSVSVFRCVVGLGHLCSAALHWTVEHAAEAVWRDCGSDMWTEVPQMFWINWLLSLWDVNQTSSTQPITSTSALRGSALSFSTRLCEKVFEKVLKECFSSTPQINLHSSGAKNLSRLLAAGWFWLSNKECFKRNVFFIVVFPPCRTTVHRL